MGILLVFLTQLLHNGEGMLMKSYGKKYGDGGLIFNAVISFFL